MDKVKKIAKSKSQRKKQKKVIKNMDYNINKPCQHYERGCLIQAPCCKLWYPCRLCHNELYQGPKSDGCKVETLDRYAISNIQCLKCKREQKPQSVCENEECKHDLGKYFCSICNLFNNDTKKDIYHCDKCNMCRIGKQSDNFHCDTCDICMNKSLQNNHKCLEKKLEANCPICLENLKSSTKFWMQLEICGHAIHTDCLDDYCEKSDNPNCPQCGVCIEPQDELQKQMYENYIKEAYEKMDPQLKKEIEGKKANILCNECGKKSMDVDFNIVAMICTHCKCYNTKQI